MTPITTATGKPARRSKWETARAIAITPDGKTAFVANFGTGR